MAGAVAWLTSKARWLTSKARPGPAKSDNQAVEINQFKDTFQPDDGVFSLNLPLRPMDVQVPRIWDFHSSYNTTFTPRSREPIGFQELRFLAENHDITRLATREAEGSARATEKLRHVGLGRQQGIEVV